MWQSGSVLALPASRAGEDFDPASSSIGHGSSPRAVDCVRQEEENDADYSTSEFTSEEEETVSLHGKGFTSREITAVTDQLQKTEATEVTVEYITYPDECCPDCISDKCGWCDAFIKTPCGLQAVEAAGLVVHAGGT